MLLNYFTCLRYGRNWFGSVEIFALKISTEICHVTKNSWGSVKVLLTSILSILFFSDFGQHRRKSCRFRFIGKRCFCPMTVRLLLPIFFRGHIMLACGKDDPWSHYASMVSQMNRLQHFQGILVFQELIVTKSSRSFVSGHFDHKQVSRQYIKCAEILCSGNINLHN